MSRVDSKWMPAIIPEIEISEGFGEALAEKMKNPKATIVIISNHFDHANGVEMMAVSKTVLEGINANRPPENQLERTRLVIAKSIKHGLQNAFLQLIVEQAEKKGYLAKYHLSTIECVTKNDQERRNMDMTGNIGFFKQLMRLARAKKEALGIFVEGSVDGGRFTDGKRNGMRPPISGLDQIFETLTAHDGEIVFVPFGTNGINRIHTNSKIPTLAAIKSLYLDRNPGSLVNIKMGMPITYTEIKQQIQEQKGHEASPEDIRDYLGRNCIAPLVPPDFQGVYRKI